MLGNLEKNPEYFIRRSYIFSQIYHHFWSERLQSIYSIETKAFLLRNPWFLVWTSFENFSLKVDSLLEIRKYNKICNFLLGGPSNNPSCLNSSKTVCLINYNSLARKSLNIFKKSNIFAQKILQSFFLTYIIFGQDFLKIFFLQMYRLWSGCPSKTFL